MNDIFLFLILTITSISTVLLLAEAVGFLPDKVSRWLNRNRLSQTIVVLKEFGIDIDKHKRCAISADIPIYYDDRADLEKGLIEELRRLCITENVTVGKTETVYTKFFIDLMGASTNPEIAKLFARYLSTYWKRVVKDKGVVQIPDFDFVVTPKMGSPILGYEFSQIIQKPFVLHVFEDKFQTQVDNPQRKFDFGKHVLHLPEKGSKALLVDDSATGGRKMIDAIEDLRKYGYNVSDCLIVFEPTIKNVRERLRNRGVILHSIIQIGDNIN